MRSVVVLAILTGLVINAPIRAGVYTTFDSPEETRLSQDFLRGFHGVLGELRTISLDKPDRDTAIRKRYVLMEGLGRKGALELKTLEQQLNYSAVLIRRGKADEAIAFLGPITREHPNNFLVHSHYATAHYLTGNDDFRRNAADLMKQTLEMWPAYWDDLDAEQKAFLEKLGWVEPLYAQNRKYEVYFLKLLRHRNREDALRRQKKGGADTLDPLFIRYGVFSRRPVHFVNADGAFQVGRVAGDEKAALPGDAVEIVEQLLVWMPNDVRLYWQLAEVLNAQATDQKPPQRTQTLRGAHQILKELIGGLREPPKDLADHFDELDKYFREQPPDAIPVDLQNILNRPDDDESLLRNKVFWRALIVGLITGFIIGMFTLWQLQEVRRRRIARMSDPVEGDPDVRGS